MAQADHEYEIDTEAMVTFALRLLREPSPSGQEGAVAALVQAEMGRLGLAVDVDVLGNVTGTVDRRLPLHHHAPWTCRGRWPPPCTARPRSWDDWRVVGSSSRPRWRRNWSKDRRLSTWPNASAQMSSSFARRPRSGWRAASAGAQR